jgi:hypothetical protein
MKIDWTKLIELIIQLVKTIEEGGTLINIVPIVVEIVKLIREARQQQSLAIDWQEILIIIQMIIELINSLKGNDQNLPEVTYRNVPQVAYNVDLIDPLS